MEKNLRLFTKRGFELSLCGEGTHSELRSPSFPPRTPPSPGTQCSIMNFPRPGHVLQFPELVHFRERIAVSRTCLFAGMQCSIMKLAHFRILSALCRQPFEQASKDIIPGHVWTQYPANCGHQYGHKYITLLRKPQSDKPRGVRGLAPDCITKINGKFWPGIKSFCGRVLSHYLAGQCVFTGRITVQTARVRNHRILSPQYYSYYS